VNQEALTTERGRGTRVVIGLLVGALALSLAMLPGFAEAGKGKGKAKGHKLTVMTRNLYLGADLGPALQAGNINDAIDAAGVIANQLHATKFPSVRAAKLAAEIKKRKPDVVGLQEAAWWRIATPANTGPALSGVPTATQTDPEGGDFIADLLSALNKKGNKGKGKKKGKAGAAKKGKKKAGLRYKLAVVKPEFDYELPVNNGSGGLAAATHNERLTMRDAILVRKGAGIKTSKPRSGTFNSLLRVQLAGFLNVDVTRGWTALDVKAHGRKFHFVNTHFEAFDSQAANNSSDGNSYPKGGIREAQAKQLVGSGGPASRSHTILVGDLNSDFPIHGNQAAGDALAYQAITAAGLRERAKSPPPFGCCIEDPNLANPSTAGITHRVDHIMSNDKRVKFKKGGLTSTYANGLWSSDHFGVWSQLLIK
jgi:Endonuclease/Exonuclease/phosphatase family